MKILITPELIDKYCEIIGDDNPIHDTLSCVNGTTLNSSYQDAKSTDPFEASAAPYIHASSSLSGPFTRVDIEIPPGHTPVGWGSDNPAPYIFNNGTVRFTVFLLWRWMERCFPKMFH